MPYCKKVHAHNTIEGVKRCDLKYADKIIARIVNRGPTRYRKIVYNPPKVIDKQGIKIVIFQTAEPI